jgi:hypothetical protein
MITSIKIFYSERDARRWAHYCGVEVIDLRKVGECVLGDEWRLTYRHSARRAF